MQGNTSIDTSFLKARRRLKILIRSVPQDRTVELEIEAIYKAYPKLQEEIPRPSLQASDALRQCPFLKNEQTNCTNSCFPLILNLLSMILNIRQYLLQLPRYTIMSVAVCSIACAVLEHVNFLHVDLSILKEALSVYQNHFYFVAIFLSFTLFYLLCTGLHGSRISFISLKHVSFFALSCIVFACVRRLVQVLLGMYALPL